MSTTALDTQLTRMVELDRAIATRGWSTRTCLKLAERWGVDKSTVWKMKQRSDGWARKLISAEDMATYKARLLETLQEATAKAIKKEDFASVARLVHEQALITGTIAPVKVDARLTLQAVQIPVVLDAPGAPPRRLTVDELSGRIEAESARKAAIEAVCVPAPYDEAP